MPGKSAVKVYRSLSSALFPKTCCACGCFINTGNDEGRPDINQIGALLPDNAFRHIMSGYLCSSCIAEFTPVGTPKCTMCGEPFKSTTSGDHLCSSCINRKKYFLCARASAVYEGSVLKVIQAYKYSGRTMLAKPLGIMLYITFLRYYSAEDIDTLLAVPLHERRLRNRGYNQALLMIKNWPGVATDNPALSTKKFSIETEALVRRKNTSTQTGLDRRQRVKNLKNAFRVEIPQRISGKKILLVDDVYTTGSTVEECARVLVKAGAETVYVLTLARAV